MLGQEVSGGEYRAGVGGKSVHNRWGTKGVEMFTDAVLGGGILVASRSSAVSDSVGGYS